MTIPASATWCPVCEEETSGHATVCTVCGTALTTRSASSPNMTSSTQRSTTTATLLPTLNEAVGTNPNAEDLRLLMNQIHQRIETVGQVQNRLQHELQGISEALAQGVIPAEWLDPSNAVVTSRPTSQTYLKNLPRLVLQPHSALLWQAEVRVESSSEDGPTPWTTQTTLADWGIPWQAGDYQGQLLVRTKKTTTNKAASITVARQDPVIHYSDRGNGETFVEKARIAHNTGAVACLIGNHVVDPWPFFMQDSKRQATDLRIPVVLLPKAAAVKLRRQATMTTSTGSNTNITLHLQPSSHRDCVICTSALRAGDTVFRVPPCSHLFHVACLEPWLKTHHTCPTCRAPLPTDDPEYDRALTRSSRERSNDNNETFYS
jgi:hypothetical protein